MQWNDGYTLDYNIKLKIRSVVRKHQIIWSSVWLAGFVFFLCRTGALIINTRAYYHIMFWLMFLAGAVFNFYRDYKKIKRLDSERFQWAEAVVDHVQHGGRRRVAKVYTDIGAFAVGQWIYSFRANMTVTVIKYNDREFGSAVDNLIFLPDPVAYSISYSDSFMG